MARIVRKVRPVVHITVEGEAEQALVTSLKSLLTANKNGPQIKILNARGKGAQHVVETALRCAKRKDFAKRAVVLDTDTDWNDKARKMAKQGSLVVIAMEPCLEAQLLCAKGVRVPETTRECKAAFLKAFGGEAHDPQVIKRHFDADFLANAAGTCDVGRALLSLFK